MKQRSTWRWGGVVLRAVALVALAGPARGTLTGDCNGDGCVAINELITGVQILLGVRPLVDCEAIEAFCVDVPIGPPGAVCLVEAGLNAMATTCPSRGE